MGNQELSNISDYVGGLRPEIMDLEELDWDTLRASRQPSEPGRGVFESRETVVDLS